MDDPPIQHCFPPVVRDDTRLLLLGSLPGRKSLEASRYYAHPQNQFWRLVGAVIDAPLADLPYETRLERLVEARIGLWDTVAAGRRKGSLDADIRIEAASDLPALVGRLPLLRAIGFNGTTAGRIGRRALGPGAGVQLVDLPSSSPAYTLAFERKLQSWLALRNFLRT